MLSEKSNPHSRLPGWSEMWDMRFLQQNLTPGCLIGVRCEMWDCRSRISLQAAWLEWDVRCEISAAESHSRLPGWSEMLSEKSHISHLTLGCQAGVRYEMWHFSKQNLTLRYQAGVRCDIWDFRSRISLQAAWLEWDAVGEISHLTSHSRLPGWSEMWDVRFFKQNLTPVCQVGVRCEMWHFSNIISLQSARLEWDSAWKMSHLTSHISHQPGRLEWDSVWKMSHLTSHSNLADWSEILFENCHISHLTPTCGFILIK